ncbi:MAG: ADP-ribosylation factor-like protein [Candidatus Odinarchaeota archaeon]
MRFTIVGDGAVGKTSLLNTYIEGSFNPNIPMTIGVKILEKIIDQDNILTFIDVGGQPQFKIQRLNFYEGTEVLVLTFALDSRHSLTNLVSWKEEVFQTVGTRDLLLLGTKLDRWNKDEVPPLLIEDIHTRFSDELDIDIPSVYTSAVTGEGLEEVHTTFTSKASKGVKYEPQRYRGEQETIRRSRDNVNKVLKNLMENLPQIELSLLFTKHGESISLIPEHLLAGIPSETLILASAYLTACSQRLADLMEGESYIRTFVEGENGYLIDISVNKEVDLLVSVRKPIKLGLIFFDLKTAAVDLAELLSIENTTLKL